MDTPILIGIPGISALLCLSGCAYFSWELYMQCHGVRDDAVLDEILKESWRYHVGWLYWANVHILFRGERIEKKIHFHAPERLTEAKPGEYQIPVVIHVDRHGGMRILVYSAKALLVVLIAVCGICALMMALPVFLVFILQLAELAIANEYMITRFTKGGSHGII